MPRERESLIGDEGSATGSRLAAGCAVGCVALVLLAGAIGIAIGASERLSGWDFGDDAPDDVIDDEDDTPPPPDPTTGADPARPGELPPAPSPDDMRRRYRPGPFVQIESLVPSGRLMPSIAPGQGTVTRTVDTPWVVPGAQLRPGPMPRSAAGGPTVTHDAREAASQPLTVLARTPARALVRARDASGGAGVTGYLVAFDGYDGHFYLPATVPTELGVVQAGGSDGATVYFAIQSPVMPNGVSVTAGQRFDVTLRIAAVDAQGRASVPVTRPLSVVAVGSGDVEVTLTMGEPTDLDLYVTDPAGVVVYYGNTNSFSGGHLDLDANAACSSNVGVDNEHIYWPAGRAPVGRYRVHVAHYQSCIQGRAVSYRVTVSACGETAVFTGRFDGSSRSQSCQQQPSRTDRSWCQHVVTFDMPGCAAR